MDVRQKLLMDAGWRFHLGDVAPESVSNFHRTYLLTKAERGDGPAGGSYDDQDWRIVRLPHDFVIEGTPDQRESAAQGYLRRDNAWYRRYFYLDPSDRGRRISLLFDGIVSESTVWVNGHLLGRNHCGYTGFEVDLTDVAKFGEEPNVVSVYVDNRSMEGWWYEGGGIYRHAWLIKTDRLCVDLWGVFVNPVRATNGGAGDAGGERWKIDVTTTIRNDYYTAKTATVRSEVLDAEGNVVARTASVVTVGERDKVEVRQTTWTSDPKLWSIEEPNLYSLASTVEVDGATVDEERTGFGFRTIEYTPDGGFFLNGKQIKQNGMCAHQEHGGLGVALPDRVQEYRLRMLKRAGANAFRSTHNPPAPELLDACDRLGMMVMDENRWLDSSPEGIRQLEVMIRRDRNHPSVVLWSMFNEESLNQNERGHGIYRALASAAKRLDTSRPVIAAPNSGVRQDAFCQISDILGFNYNYDAVDELHERWNKPHVNTETHVGNYLGGTDGWELVDRRPYVVGMYPWGIEHRGESDWPRMFAPWGMLDHCCYPKHHFYLYKAYWSESPTLKIVPIWDWSTQEAESICRRDQFKQRYSSHWNWRDRLGEAIDVWTYTNGDSAELFLNGRSLGEKAVDPYRMARWSVPYEPGLLTAIARKQGRIVADDSLETTGDPIGLRLDLEDAGVRADGEDVAILTARAVDAEGRFVPSAYGYEVEFIPNEHGQVIAVDTADAADHSPWKSSRRRMHMGLVQAIVRSDDQPGQLVIRARSEQLGEAELVIDRESIGQRPSVADVPSPYVATWLVSPHLVAVQGVDEIAAHADTASWRAIAARWGACEALAGSEVCVVYHAETTIPAWEIAGERNTSLLFESVIGRVVVRVGKEGTETRGESVTDRSGTLRVELPGFGPGDRVSIWLVASIVAPGDAASLQLRHCGIDGPVRWVTGRTQPGSSR